MNFGYHMYAPGECPLVRDGDRVAIDPKAFTILFNDTYCISSLNHSFAGVIYLTWLNLHKADEKRGQDYLHGVMQGFSYLSLNGGKFIEG